MRGLSGKRAIVTGAASGIGKGITERLLEEGCFVIAADRDQKNLDAMAVHERMKTLACDVTDADAPAALISACVEAFGGIDILVNNAGVGDAPKLHKATDDDFDRSLNVNLRSVFRISREVLPYLRQSRGTIVNTSSSTAILGYRLGAAYTAAKAGIIGLTRNMAAEYGPEGIRVNAIAPGITRTALTDERLKTPAFKALVVSTQPLGIIGEPKDIAAAVAFLASEDAAFITGQILAVDGGQTATVYVSDEMIQAFENSKGE